MEALDPHRRAASTERRERRCWRCPNCGQMIGEIVGVRLIVKAHGRTLTFRVTPEMTQTCPKCGFESEYDGS